MVEHTAKRIYRNSELGLWYRRVVREWEKPFRPEEMEYGRKLYKKGVVRTLELNSDEAIICARLDDASEPYCVIDFEGEEFVYRGSQTDDFLTGALTVAGFYEIEELIADVFSMPEYIDFDWFKKPAPRIAPVPFPAVARGQNSAEPAAPSGTPSEQSFEKPDLKSAEKKAEPAPTRRLVLSFASRRRGLAFNANWETADGKTRKAFGEKCVPVDSLNSSECENLIRLATLARKAAFKYDGDMYILSEIAKIPSFLGAELPKWKKFFTIKKDKKVDLLKAGERRVELRPMAKAVSGDSSDFDVEWSPCVGDEAIDPAELSRLVGGSTSLRILPDYGIVRVSNADTQFVREVERSREFGFKGGKIPRYMLLSLSDFGARISLSAELKSWMDSLMRKPTPTNEELPNFLRKYQALGVEWADKLFAHDCNAMIADEMGLGKTIQTLTLINSIKGRAENVGGAGKFFVVCPASVIPVWVSETKKFFPNISTGVLTSKSDISSADLWISSYTQLRRNRQIVEKTEFELAVLDEAQFIKNPDAKTTGACMGLKAKRKIALTGTPVENRLLDMWTSFRWLMPGLMGSRKSFENLVAGGANAVEVIRRQIAPFVLRRVKTEVATELPEKVYLDLFCPMSEQQRSEYQKLLAEARERVRSGSVSSDNRERFTILSLLTRLRQAACDAALLPWIGREGVSETGGKMSVLLDRVEELYAGGKKVLVFSQFTKFLAIAREQLQTRMGGVEIFELTGSTRDRSVPVESFQNAKGGALMLISLRAGGTGITLTSADYVFLADPWWNPAVEEQAIDRVHRIGRKGDVFVYKMYAQDTIEDKVRKLQAQKRKMFDELIGDLKDVSNASKFIETINDLLE